MNLNPMSHSLVMTHFWVRAGIGSDFGPKPRFPEKNVTVSAILVADFDNPDDSEMVDTRSHASNHGEVSV